MYVHSVTFGDYWRLFFTDVFGRFFNMFLRRAHTAMDMQTKANIEQPNKTAKEKKRCNDNAIQDFRQYEFRIESK